MVRTGWIVDTGHLVRILLNLVRTVYVNWSLLYLASVYSLIGPPWILKSGYIPSKLVLITPFNPLPQTRRILLPTQETGEAHNSWMN